MKNKFSIIIDNILEDEQVNVLPNNISYKKNNLKIAFVDKSEYEEWFNNENKTSQYIFNDRKTKHLLLIKEKYYNKYPNLYSDIVIKSTLRLFVNRRKNQRIIKSLIYTIIILAILMNVLIISANGLNKVIFIPIISIIILGILYYFGSKLISDLYLKDREATQRKLKSLLPNLDKEIEQEKKEKV